MNVGYNLDVQIKMIKKQKLETDYTEYVILFVCTRSLLDTGLGTTCLANFGYVTKVIHVLLDIFLNVGHISGGVSIFE